MKMRTETFPEGIKCQDFPFRSLFRDFQLDFVIGNKNHLDLKPIDASLKMF